MKTFHFAKEFVERYKKFLASEEYNSTNEHSKSAYWEHFADMVGVEISGQKITVKGVSGFYIPQKRGIVNKILNLTKVVITNPSRIVKRLMEKMWLQKNDKTLIPYEASFDAVMTQYMSDTDTVNQCVIDIKKIAENERSYLSVKDIKDRSQNDYALNGQIIYSHYIFNILNALANLASAKTVLEIGGGNGNLLSVLRYNDSKMRLIDVDLPETLSHAILYIADLFPEASIMMPNEVNIKNIEDCDIVFLTPSQIDWIEDDSIDISINTFSFQEMTHKQIKEYFDFIQRSGKNDSYFFTSNRTEKTPSTSLTNAGSNDMGVSKELPNRFNDYPWNKKNEILANQKCRLMEKVQNEEIFIRLEKIKKSIVV